MKHEFNVQILFQVNSNTQKGVEPQYCKNQEDIIIKNK